MMIDAARHGGSVPKADFERLQRSGVEPTISENALAKALASDADDVWLATGHVLDASTDPLLASLQAATPTPIHGGLPVLDEDLRWPGTRVHLMGGYGALTLGPASRNLWGARHGAARIVEALGVSRPPRRPRRAR
jgi:hypothetical protein